ncbi:MAG: hypothetical protein WCU88_00285 [Elusimicrobiota bacterium]
MNRKRGAKYRDLQVSDVIDGLRGRVIFITGSAKNAGKTTFLNYALNCLRPAHGRSRTAFGGGASSRCRSVGPVGFLSVGVDGEPEDLVFGSPKPRVRAAAGDLLATTDRLLAASDAGCELLQVFPGTTALGRMVLARASREGFVELAGPENNSRLPELIEALQKKGAKTVLIDGAVDRVTQVSSGGAAGFVLVVRVDPRKLGSAQDLLRLQSALSRVEVRGGALPEDGADVEGALTQQKLSALPVALRVLRLEDPGKVFLSWREWREASRTRKFLFKQGCEFLGCCAVLFDVSREDFERGLAPEDLANVFYNPYEEPV